MFHSSWLELERHMIDLQKEVSSSTDGEEGDNKSRCEEKRLLAHKFQVCLDLVDNLKKEQQQQQANSSNSSVCGEETITRSESSRTPFMKKTGAAAVASDLPTSLSWNTSFQQPSRNKRDSNIDSLSDQGSDFNVGWESDRNSLFLTLHTQNAKIPKVVQGEKRTAVVSRMVSREKSNYEDVRNIKNAVQKKLESCRKSNDANDSGFVCSQDSSAKSSVSGISPTSPNHYSPEQVRFNESDQLCNSMLQRSEITYSISEGLYDKLSFDDEYQVNDYLTTGDVQTCECGKDISCDQNVTCGRQFSSNSNNGHQYNYESTLKTQIQWPPNVAKNSYKNCATESAFNEASDIQTYFKRFKTANETKSLNGTNIGYNNSSDVNNCDDSDYYRLDSVGDCCCQCEECRLTATLSDCDCTVEDYDDHDTDSICSCCSCSDISVISAGTQTDDQLNPDYDTVYEVEQTNQTVFNHDQNQPFVDLNPCCNTCQCSPSREINTNTNKQTIPPPPPIRQNTLTHHTNPQEVIRKHFSTFNPQTYTPEQSPCHRFNRRSFTNEFYALTPQNESSSPSTESPKYNVDEQVFNDDYNATLRPQKQSNPFVIPNKFLDDLKITSNNPFLSTFGPQDIYSQRQTLNIDTDSLYQHQYSNEQALRLEQNMLTFTNTPTTAVNTKKSAINNNPYCSPMVARRLLAHQTQSSQHSLVRTRYGSLDDINETLEQDDSQSDSTDFRIAETINIGKNDTLTKKMKSKWRMVRKAITRGSSMRKNSKN